ncbi:MAG: amino acid ABC transporter [Sulfurovum sp.]|nr:amino acid ABC transporter [Sulfurovum sp.]
MDDDPHIYKTFLAPKTTKWTILTIIDNVQQVAFLDKNLILISKYKKEKNYDPRQRIWYSKALTTKKIISTKPYLYANLQRMGVSYATELESKGTVLALDYTMVQLNAILASQDPTHNAEVFLTNEKGEKFASSLFLEEEPKEDRKLTAYLQKHIQNHKPTKETAHVAKYSHYYYIIKPLHANTGYLGITVDARPLLKPYYENLRYAMEIALALLLLTLPLIIWSSRRIAKPIEALMIENEKIKQRAYDKVKPIESNIIEFIGLSKSQVALSQSIQDFEKSQEEILDAIIKLIADAIDAKSPYTGGHCHRVPMIAKALLDEANASQTEAFKDFTLNSKDELRAFEIGTWLHDCGKVTTPEYVVDKATKLETIYNRIHEIRMRFEVLWRDAHIAYLSKEIDQETLQERQKELKENFAFIASVNIGAESMSPEDQARVKEIAKEQWTRHFDDRLGLGEEEILRHKEENDTLPQTETLLADKAEHIISRENFDGKGYAADGFKLEVPENLYDYGEVYNLCIERGTLTTEERYKINEHVIMSIKMLENIPFPKSLSNLVEYAGTHHETLIGTGYPRGLSKEDLSIPARIMAIADIFEALTAADRPYKAAKTLSVSIEIMAGMVKRQHIDADLFKLFLNSGVYKRYAQVHLDEAQIDDVDITQYRDL